MRGVIESVGPGVTRVSPGDHVILSWSPECGKCFYCLRGKTRTLRNLHRAPQERDHARRHHAF